MSYDLIKSPLNYTGGKFKLLSKILPLFPKEIDTFVDLFGGGFNVGVNVNANNHVYNDINSYVYNLLKNMENFNIHDVENIIQKYKLSKENKEGFLKLRDDFNSSKEDMVKLYTLVCYSFNYQFRFNNNLEYNGSFGKNKSSFNANLKNRFISYKEKISDMKISYNNRPFSFVKNLNLTGKDLVYCDPPYLISTASYNDGKRGFGDWKEEDELNLLELLDYLDKNNIRFALSNVLEHKGLSNDILKEWSKKYNIHYLNYNYKNCSYQGKNTDKPTIEVLITNY